ncbi:acetyltransferase [Gillisia sp. JM1]|uniref:acetyltransferase n=1 Tax=Gillisia sp. JM1 TaxID=1283286 RepID=UPI0004146AF4|nr:acetyltransferase [Gillisia sp. JM1]
MEEIIYKTCTSKKELEGILQLQNENHYSKLSKEEIASEGFLTCTHNLDLLTEFNTIALHIIAVSNDKVIAYLLTMTAIAEAQMPLLKPMFLEFEKVFYSTKHIAEYNYLIVGQVCVGKGFRGQGVLEKCYKLYKAIYKDRFDFAITEIDLRNQRSLKAHLKLGFREIHRYFSPDGVEWCIVLLDWNK